MTIDPAAEHGFGAGADAYDRGRPSYPAAAVAFLAERMGLGPDRRVLDLAAGTGKLTELLVASGAEVVAVEPVENMRTKLTGRVGVTALDGTAEAIPLPEQDVDVVTAAQAFHWFNAPLALAEIARVLRPRGGLALVWNSRDGRVPWVAELIRIIRWNKGQIPTYDAGDERWTDVIADDGRFSPVEMREFPNEHVLDIDTLIDRESSVSYIASMESAERDAIMTQVRDLVAEFPARFVLPYRTFVYTCTRLEHS